MFFDIATFDFNDKLVRFVKNKYWKHHCGIIAVDLADALDYSDVNVLTVMLKPKWLEIIEIEKIDLTVIAIEGMYHILNKSTKPKVEDFRSFLNIEDVDYYLNLKWYDL